MKPIIWELRFRPTPMYQRLYPYVHHECATWSSKDHHTWDLRYCSYCATSIPHELYEKLEVTRKMLCGTWN